MGVLSRIPQIGALNKSFQTGPFWGRLSGQVLRDDKVSEFSKIRVLVDAIPTVLFASSREGGEL